MELQIDKLWRAIFFSISNDYDRSQFIRIHKPKEQDYLSSFKFSANFSPIMYFYYYLGIIVIGLAESIPYSSIS